MARLVRLLYLFGPAAAFLWLFSRRLDITPWVVSYFAWSTIALCLACKVLFDPIPNMTVIASTRGERFWAMSILVTLQFLGLLACFAPFLLFKIMHDHSPEMGPVGGGLFVVSVVLACLFNEDNRQSIIRLGYLYRWARAQPILTANDPDGVFNWHCLAGDSALWQEIPATEQLARQIADLSLKPGFRAPDLICFEHGVHLFVERRIG